MSAAPNQQREGLLSNGLFLKPLKSIRLTDNPKLSVGVFDAPVVFSNTLVHSGVLEGQTGKLQLPFSILEEDTEYIKAVQKNKTFFFLFILPCIHPCTIGLMGTAFRMRCSAWCALSQCRSECC